VIDVCDAVIHSMLKQCHSQWYLCCGQCASLNLACAIGAMIALAVIQPAAECMDAAHVSGESCYDRGFVGHVGIRHLAYEEVKCVWVASKCIAITAQIWLERTISKNLPIIENVNQIVRIDVVLNLLRTKQILRCPHQKLPCVLIRVEICFNSCNVGIIAFACFPFQNVILVSQAGPVPHGIGRIDGNLASLSFVMKRWQLIT
jgi:hypothetical protein